MSVNSYSSNRWASDVAMSALQNLNVLPFVNTE